MRSTTSLALGDLADHRVVGRQARRPVARDDEELASGRARRLGRGLRHRDDAVRVRASPAAAGRPSCSRGRRCRSRSGRRPGSRSPGRSGGRRCRRRSRRSRAPRTTRPRAADAFGVERIVNVPQFVFTTAVVARRRSARSAPSRRLRLRLRPSVSLARGAAAARRCVLDAAWSCRRSRRRRLPQPAQRAARATMTSDETRPHQARILRSRRDRTADERARDLDLVRGSRRAASRRRARSSSRASHGIGATPGEREPDAAPEARGRDADERRTPNACGPSPSGRRSPPAAGTSSSTISSSGSSVVASRSSSVGSAVELGERKLAPVGPDRRAEREQRRRRVGRVRGRAEVVREDRVLAVLALARVAAVAAVEPARELQPPVPAARRLEQVAADRAHVAELRRGGEAARLPQRVGDLRVALELGERRSGADASVPRTPRGTTSAHVDERLGPNEPVAQ